MLMFRVLLFFIFASSSFGLSITLNNGKTGGNDYYILHIENEREFSCQVKVGNNYYPPDARHDGAEQRIPLLHRRRTKRKDSRPALAFYGYVHPC